MLPLPSLIANLTNLTEVLVWLTEVISLANRSASLQVCSLHLLHTGPLKQAELTADAIQPIPDDMRVFLSTLLTGNKAPLENCSQRV